MSNRRMFRYVVPVDDEAHIFTLTSDPVAVAATDDEGAVEFWAEHEQDAAMIRSRAFRVFCTGHPLPGDATWVGTCPRTPLGAVWHLYEVTP
jgi:hypothetical protein